MYNTFYNDQDEELIEIQAARESLDREAIGKATALLMDLGITVINGFDR